MQLLTPKEHSEYHKKTRIKSTRCSRGHLRDEKNTYFNEAKQERICRTCANLRQAKYREKKRKIPLNRI